VGDHIGISGTASKDAQGRLFFFNGNERDELLIGKTKIERWEWHHLVYVREGAKVSVYLDGELEIKGKAAVTLPPTVKQVFIGGRNDGYANFEGRIDEAAVYGRALSAEEVRKHYDAATKK